MSYCPYCSLAHSHSAGEVYCSRQMPDFGSLQNGIFSISGSNIQSGLHYSRFALRFIINGRMDFTLDNKKHAVHNSGVLLFGQNSSYLLHIPEQPVASSHIGIAFNPGFLQQAAGTLYRSADKLLEIPDEAPWMPLSALQLWPLSSKASVFRQRLINSIANETQDTEAINDIAADILQWYMEEYCRYNTLLPRFSETMRASARDELLRRVDIAREIIEYSGNGRLTVSTVAAVACLSEFHFIRVYKQVFGISPYQHIVAKKMHKAHSLLTGSSLEIQEIAFMAGYDNHAAFSRAFKLYYNCPPSAVRTG